MKWFILLVARMYGKVALMFASHLVHHYIHYRKSVDKLLEICAVGIVPFDNNLQKDGKAYKFDLARNRGLVIELKDSFKQV